MNLARLRLILWGAVGVAVLGFGSLSLYQALNPPKAPVADRTGLIPPSDQIGGPFSLTSVVDGKTVTDKDFVGKATAFFFGFTHCPDVCPTTLAEAAGWLEALGPDADKIRFVFVSVDPERDTADVLKNYIAAFDGRIGGLTGTPEAVDQIMKAYRVYARKVPLQEGGYTMDHTAGVYLMNRDMKLVGLLSYREETQKALTKLKALVKG